MIFFKKNKYKKVIYIDCENVGFLLPEVIQDDYLYYYFANTKSAKISLNDVFIIKKNPNIKLFDLTHEISGKNAMDFMIIIELTKAILKFGTKTKYYIVTKDKGFQTPISLLQSKENATIERVEDINQIEE